MAINVNAEFSISIYDKTHASAKMSLPSDIIGVANIVATENNFADLVTKTIAMTEGTLKRWSVSNVNVNSTVSWPTSPTAMKSHKFAVTFQDQVDGKTFTSQIPVANEAGVTYLGNTDLLDLTATPTSDYVTSFQTAVKIPNVGGGTPHAVVILQIRAVGRHFAR